MKSKRNAKTIDLSNVDQAALLLDHGINIDSRVLNIKFDACLDDNEVTVGPTGAFDLINGLGLLNAISSDPIELILNCPGGTWEHGMAMYQAVKSSISPITCTVMGQAQSMGAIILQAAKTRRMHDLSVLMLHDGEISMSGSLRDVERAIEFARKQRLEAYEMFAQRTGKPKKYFYRKMGYDWHLTANEALNENLIDEVIK